MLKNNLYVYGPDNLELPVKLNFGDHIVKKLWEFKERTLLINGITEETFTFGQILQESMNVAVSLTGIGVRKGHVVGICTENRREYWPAIIGTICTGAIITALNPMYSEDELKQVLNISKPNYLFCSPIVYKRHEKTLKSLTYVQKFILFGDATPNNVISYNDLAVAVKNNVATVFENNRLTKDVTFEEFEVADVQGQSDVAIILNSSGTTGLPKGVMITHYNILFACIVPPSLDSNLPGLFVTPWYHAMGLFHMLEGIITGKTTIYLPKFDVNQYLKTIEKYKIQQILLVPPIVVAICKSQTSYDLSSMKVVYCGAATLKQHTIADLKKKFTNLRGVIQGLGMTETTQAIIRGVHQNVEEYKPGSLGFVVPGCVIKVIDVDTRQPLGPNKPGEICVKGALVMKGYLGADVVAAFDDEGFFKTGDVGYYDDDKQFFIVDRLKEIIKYKGFQVPPVEVEAVLLQHGSVADAGVVGLPDTTAGELPLAFVVKQPGKNVTEEELQKFVAERLSNPKHLRGGVRFVAEIPKNPSGKIIRKLLKSMVTNTKSKL